MLRATTTLRIAAFIRQTAFTWKGRRHDRSPPGKYPSSHGFEWTATEFDCPTNARVGGFNRNQFRFVVNYSGDGRY
jgi:hypothetical protein